MLITLQVKRDNYYEFIPQYKMNDLTRPQFQGKK